MAAEFDGKKNAGTSRMGTCGKGIVLVACCVASASALAATVTLNGETTYNVESGTNTVSDTLTGGGSILKTGNGALNLTGEGNDFTGGTKVNAGAVLVNALNALGSGSVEVAAKTAGVWFNVAPATTGGYTLFGNALTFTGPEDCSFGGAALGVDRLGDSSGDGARNAIFFQNTRLTNSISGTRSYRLRHNPKNTGGPLNGGPSTIFDGPLSVAEGKGIFLNVYGTMTINGPITATILSGGEAWSGGGYLDLNNPANRIGRMYVASDRVRCGDTNVLGGAELVWRVTCEALGATDCAWVDLCGHNQTVAALRQYIFGGSATAGWNKTRWEAEDNRKGISVKSDQPATLTITGMADDKEACTMVRGAVSLVLDAQDYPSFTQTFTHFKSAFTGTTTVRKGTLRITGKARFTGTPSITVEPGAAFVNASTNTQPSLANVTNLVVRGTFDASTATLNPFVKTLKNLEVASGATLKLPEGSLVNAQSVTLGGQTFTSGHLTADRLAALSGATVSGITVVVGNGEAVNWTGAVSESFSTVGNWDPALASADDLAGGMLHPTFAAAGTRATVDADAIFMGMTFRAAAGQAGFTLARDAATPPHGLTICRGPVGAYLNDAAGTAHTYTIDAPLALEGPVTFHADTNQTLVLRNAFHDTAAVQGRVLTIDGGGVNGNTAYGKVVFAGTNVVGGAIVSTSSLWRVSGKLANPGDAYTGNPRNDDSEAIRLRVNKAITSGGTTLSYGIELDNATIGKSILVDNVMGLRSFTALNNTTNEITGFLCYNPATSNHHGMALMPGSVTTLSGGLHASHSFRIYNGGTLRIRERPVTCLCSAGFNPSNGKAIFDVPGNTFAYMLLGYSGYGGGSTTVEMLVNNVMTNGAVEVGGDGGSAGQANDISSGTHTLDIHCTTQRCAIVAVRTRGVLTGEYPAMLEVYEGRPDNPAKAKYVVIGKVEGGVGFNLCGAGTLTFTNRAFASCGDLVVSKGVMEFAHNATWLNGTNVTVTGSGTLKLNAGGRFDGKKAVLHLGADADSWKIDIPAGQTQKFDAAFDATGKQLPGGFYGNAASGASRTRYAAHFPHNGVVYVRQGGLQIIFR
ncbi:MAG: hypothetical protein IJI36_10355 [Kiritimatiellae bacterium]|nr:hypothetical protein [Kiritimatiellia bacterium]